MEPATQRKCPVHGWLYAEEYTVDAVGETICKECEKPTVDYRKKT